LRRSGAKGSVARKLYAQKKTNAYKERDEEARRAFAEELSAIPPETVFYVDETGLDEVFHREKGRAKRGAKVYGSVSGRKFIAF